MLSWGRVRFTLIFSALFGLMLGASFQSGVLVIRTVLVAAVAMLAFGLFERWPKRLPSWIARWVLQVAGVAFAVPIGMIMTLITFGLTLLIFVLIGLIGSLAG